MWWPKPLRSGMPVTIVCYWAGLANRLSSCFVLSFLCIRLVSFEYMLFYPVLSPLLLHSMLSFGKSLFSALVNDSSTPSARRFSDSLLNSIQAIIFPFSVLRAGFLLLRDRGLTHSSRRLQETSHLSEQLNSSAQRGTKCCRITDRHGFRLLWILHFMLLSLREILK